MQRVQFYFISVLTCLAVSASGCLYSPENNTELPSRDTPVMFYGFSPEDSVDILAAPSPADTFETITTIAAAPGDGEFSTTLPVDLQYWRPICNRSGGWQTYVRAQIPAGGVFVTYDSASVTGVSGQNCVTQHVNRNDLWGALSCASPDSPNARLFIQSNGSLAQSIDGDVSISNPADADALACVETISGSLTIDDGVAQDIILPSLYSVSGDLTIVYERDPTEDSVSAEKVFLPELVSVGGNVNLSAPDPGIADGYMVAVDFGMPKLVLLAGSITIDIDAFNTYPRGLAVLPAIAGNLDYHGGSADSSSSGLLAGLQTIGGNLNAVFGTSTTLSFFNSLHTINGDATIENGQWVADNLADTGLMFQSLQQVAGTLSVVNVEIITPPFKAFDALTSAGALDWDSGGDFSQIGSAAISVGGLRLNDNAWLVDLPTTMSRFTVASSASIEITNNSNLSDCDANAWVGSLPGHVGPVTIAGNQSCP